MHYLLYALTLLISSSLLFAMQPMAAKMIQPVLGGTPAVWNTAMVFFQALLLGGYLYAHVTTRWLGARRQAVLHIAVLAVGFLFLPIAFEAPTDPASLQAPALWLLMTLLVALGWPFFVVSTSAPLLQKWFSTLDHHRAGDPYYLYAASNVGSVCALLAYPLLIEPNLGLHTQSFLWMLGYALLGLSVTACATALWKSPPSKTTQHTEHQDIPPASQIAVTWKRRLQWMAWAFIPSSLMLSVTTFITTDIAPVPLLWIPPLAIYMLSFIAAFARRQPIPLTWWFVLFGPMLAAASGLLATDIASPLWAVTAINFAALFVFCMVFHGLLAADRPHTDDLTDFYIWVAVGGVLGGSFNALAAPLLFDRLLEYPAVLLVAALVIPTRIYGHKWVQYSLTLSALSAAGYVVYRQVSRGLETGSLVLSIVLALVAVAGFAVINHRRSGRWTSAAIGLVLCLVLFVESRPDDDEIYAARSFFGTHQVVEASGGDYHLLYHGKTRHGAQARPGDARDVPLSYYFVTGPLGQTFDALQTRPQRHPIGAVGLGVGAVATYTQPDQTLDIFEIDAEVETIATNPDYFSYIDDCPGHCRIIIGDGRLQLEAADDNRYELIVLDAYSSAAVPVHLLTLEAIEAYFDKLRPDGILAIHISSRHLDMVYPLGRAAEQLGFSSRTQHHIVDARARYEFYIENSEWLVIARNDQALGPLASDHRWQTIDIPDDVDVWTDDYANLLQIYQF